MFFSSCGSTTSLKVNTDPTGAKVFIKNVNSNAKIEIGVTPLDLDQEKIKQKRITPGPVVIEFKKDNFFTTNLYVTDVVGVNVDITLPLKQLDRAAFAKDFDKVTSQVMIVQRYIKDKTFNKALEVTKTLRKEFPALSTPNEMEGNIFYLMKKFKESHEAFLAALSKNSDNTYALQMIKILEKNNGIVGKKK